MIVHRRRALSTTIAGVAIVLIIVVAGAGYYLYSASTGGTTTLSTSSTTAANKVFRILMIDTTPVTTSWGQEVLRGLLAAVNTLNNTNGKTIKITTAFNIGYADAQSFMQTYAQQGYDMIIAQDVGYGSATTAVAAQFPNTQFFGPTFTPTSNLGAWEIDHFKGEYEAGVIAGLMTKSNIIGYVTAFNYPDAVRGITNFCSGAALVNHDVTLYYAFAGDWSDSVKGSAAASSIIAKGADVIAGFGNGMADGVVAGAKAAGVFAIGYLHDANSLAPNTVLTSVMLNSAPYYVAGITAAFNGQIGYKNFALNIHPDNVTYLTPFHGLLPADKLAIANPILKNIITGTLTPPNNATLPAQGFHCSK